jgi:hypothetical protein
MRLILVLALFIFGLALWGITSVVPAVQAQVPSDRLTVVVFDRESIQANQENLELINSFLGLFFKLKEGQQFMFIQLDEPTTSLGPAKTDSREFDSVLSELDEVLLATTTSPGAGMIGTLAEVYNLLGSLSAGAESVIYFVTASESATNAPDMIARLEPVLALHAEASWSVFTVALPGTDADFQNVLENISDRTGGESYLFEIPDGMRNFADRTLRLEGKGSLSEIGGGTLNPNSVLIMDLNIAPGTDQTNIMFFKDNEVTAFRLKNPDGFEASTGDRTSSSIAELPNLVMWQLIDPVAGKWQIEIRGIRGQLSAWVFATNKYTLGIQKFGAVPVGQPTTITAFINDGGVRTTVEGAQLSVKVTAPDGLSIIHKLNDEGVNGDAIALDSYYAVTIPPLSAEGEYIVDLELSWRGFEHTIITRGSFEAQSFPVLTVMTEQTELFLPGVRTKIGTVYVNINGQPFSVLIDDIRLELATNAGEPGNIELVPQSIMTQGRAFMYDLYYTAGAEAFTTIVMRLNIEYAGRAHSFTTDTLILSSHAPTPIPSPIPIEVVATTVPTAPTLPPPPLPEGETNVPIALIVVLAVIAGIILILVIYWVSRTTPYGYLYNDEGQVVVDFSALERAPISNLLSRNIIQGIEIGIPGLEGVTFTFRTSGVYMSSIQVAPATVRVNNQPLIEERLIDDSTWIGTSGRLYNFSTKPVAREQA